MGKQHSIFDIDWTNLSQVIDQCDRLNAKGKPGHECSVVKVKGRDNYNITHTDQIKRLHGDNATIIYPIPDEGFKGYYGTDKDGNTFHTWDFEESIGE